MSIFLAGNGTVSGYWQSTDQRLKSLGQKLAPIILDLGIRQREKPVQLPEYRLCLMYKTA